MMKPPIAKKIPHAHELHGDVRQDDYYWLNEKENPEVIAYLEAENAYFKEVMEPLQEQTDELYEAMVARVPETEVDVPVQHGPYFYYSRQEKDKQYPIYARKKAADRSGLDSAPEEITLDLNELAEGSDYLSVTAQKLSDNQQLLAYLENRDGTDRYTVFVKDLETGELLPDRINDVFIYGSLEWSRSGEYLFYTTVDEQQRPSKLWRHKLGSTESDQLLYEEKEETFSLYISKTLSERFISVYVSSKTTSEIRLIDADEPLSELWLIDARREGIEYDVEHSGEDLLILTNENAQNFQLLRAPLDNLDAKEEVVPYDETKYLQGIYPFRDRLLVAGREDGLTQIWTIEGGALERLTWDEPIYTVGVLSGQSQDANEILVSFESCITPETTFSFEPKSLDRTLLQVSPVSGDYDRSHFSQKHVFATAEDGTKIPVLLVFKNGALDDGPAPLLLNAYGSYGANSDPYFSPYRLPVLERGVVYAVAQVRGGSEMGRHWYDNGKMEHKRNTFTDFIAAADYLIAEGYTTTGQLAARGGSAGGLLMGAVANMAGDRFKVIVPEVPFVDVLTTMLDTSIPLTTLEWDEWGDPRQAESYFYMKSYSPYDNVEAKDYPHLYITTGLNDPRVGYFEPAKWVARLRELKTDTNTLVMKTNMGAGHFGESGRLNQLKEVATLYSFVLDKINANSGVKA
ncbi:oligopeptidase B [Sporosarcina sp. NCCP-2716]|uniref:S9 family peptidase n=1 Tax=Sporosarcina sp. NCCP-2716 TaxID=2943679 RepID=UPI00204113C4|nr:S9 family peptidase [Sporosarcina sp. NCCP-2716]GKV68853.1 oligopeptidase B [Sporosarcina sp. NCCP-2716]